MITGISYSNMVFVKVEGPQVEKARRPTDLLSQGLDARVADALLHEAQLEARVRYPEISLMEMYIRSIASWWASEASVELG